MRLSRHILAGCAQFLLCASLLFLIFVNVGQLTQNTVSRHIYAVSATLHPDQLTATLKSLGINLKVPVAPDQGAPINEAEGIGGARVQYRWGLYSYCAGASESGPRTCSRRYWGNRVTPGLAINKDLPPVARPIITKVIDSDTKTSNHHLGSLTNGGFYVAVFATVLTGLACFASLATIPIAMMIALPLAFLGTILLMIGSAVYTDAIRGLRHHAPPGIEVKQGNIIALVWSAFALTFCATCLLCAVVMMDTKNRKVSPSSGNVLEEPVQPMKNPEVAL